MKYTMIGLLTLTFFWGGCKETKVESKEDLEKIAAYLQEKPDSSLSESSNAYYKNLKVQFDQPIAFASTPNIAIPIILNEIYVEKGMKGNNYYNLAIVDSTRSLKKLLFEESVVIEDLLTMEKQIDFDFNFYGYSDERESISFSEDFNSLIFFSLYHYENRKKDYKRLFVYNLKTDVLRQLSPEGCYVTKVVYFEGEGKLLINFQLDSDGNGKYTWRDDENMVFVGLSESTSPKPLFDLDELKEMKSLVARENEK